MKKLLSMILALMMVLSANAAVFANDVVLINEAEGEGAVSIELPLSDTYDKTLVSGVVKEINEDSVVISSGEIGFGIMYDENTFFTNQDGMPIGINDINAGAVINAVVSKMTTRSLPPKAYGYVVSTIEKTDAQAPIFVEVSDVDNSDADITTLYSADGEYVVTLGNESQISPFKSRNILSRTDITKGSCILVYSETMSMSIPALLNPSKVVVLSVGTVEEYYEASLDVMPISGKMTTFGTVTSIEDGEITIDGDNGEMVLITDESTVFTDQFANPVLKEEIKTGSMVKAVTSDASTFSLPPQTYAYVVSVIEDVNNSTVPVYFEVGEYIDTPEASDGLLGFLYSADGNYRKTVTKETSITAFNTKNILTISDLTPGSVLLLPASKLTTSLPSDVISTDIVVLSIGVQDAVKELQTPVSYVVGKVKANGIVTEINEGEITIESDNGELALMIDESTIFTNQNAEPISKEDIKVGTAVNAVVSDASTFSLPPQTYAYVISVVNDMTKSAPIYMEVGDISSSNTGAKIFKSKDGEYEIAVDSDVVVMPYKTRNIVTLNDITVGSEIMVVSSIMTMSIPALLNPEKIVVLSVADIKDNDGEFISRGELAKIVYNKIHETGFDAVKTDDENITEDDRNYFEDVSEEIKNVVAYLYSADILKGKSENKFFPDDMVTREEAAVVLERVLLRYTKTAPAYYSRIARTAFADEADISVWAIDSAYVSAELGFETYEGKFLPKGNVTRESVEKALENIITAE